MLGSDTANGHDVFGRTTTDQPLVSRGVYNLTIGAVLCWGFGLNYWMVTNIPRPRRLWSMDSGRSSSATLCAVLSA